MSFELTYPAACCDWVLDLVKDLRERDLGVLQGKNAPQDWKFKKWDSESARELQLETLEELFGRIKNFVDKILKEFKGKTILFVAHNGINLALITYLLGKNAQNIKDLETLKNTSVSIFEFDKDNNPIQRLFNCVEHLRD